MSKYKIVVNFHIHLGEDSEMASIINNILGKVRESNTLQDGMIANQKGVAKLIRKHISNKAKLEEIAAALEEQAPESAEALKANVELEAELAAIEDDEEEPTDPETPEDENEPE